MPLLRCPYTTKFFLHRGIAKTDKSDHFALFCLLKTKFEQPNINNIVIKQVVNKAKPGFNYTHCQMVLTIFFRKICMLCIIYDQGFPERKTEIKPKNLHSGNLILTTLCLSPRN